MNFKNRDHRESVGKFAGVLGIAGNVFLCIIKIFAGLMAGSVSIIADAVNNLSDAFSSVITVVSFKLSGKPADEDHPYGHERIEYIATLILAFLILFIGYELIKTSFLRILNPVDMPVNTVVVVILIVSVLCKFAMSRMYMHYAKKIDSSVLRASAKDSMNDVFSTGAVLIASVTGAVFNIKLDGYAGFAVSLFIIWSAVELIKDAVNPILGASPQKELVDEVAKKVLSYQGVIGIHDLIVHSYGPSKFFASVHAEVDAKGDIMESHDIIDNIERDVAKNMGIDLVIHMDPIVTDDEDVIHSKKCVEDIVRGIGSVLTIHDFRIVPGKTHTNLIFDIVLPFDFKYKESKVLEIVQNEVWSKMGKEYFCVINIDKNYNGV